MRWLLFTFWLPLVVNQSELQSNRPYVQWYLAQVAAPWQCEMSELDIVPPPCCTWAVGICPGVNEE